MTMADVFALRWGLLAGVGALAAVLLATGFWRLGRGLRRMERRCIELSGELRALRDEVGGNGAAVTALGGHLERLSKQLSVDGRHRGAAPAADSRGLDLAVRSARQGATEEDLIADYGMSRQEASLLRRMQGTAPVSGARRAVS